MAENEPLKEAIGRRIAGEIVLANSPGIVMRKWRTLFNISQSRLAGEMGCNASVISDYETGRRRTPGSTFIRKFVRTLILVDESSGGRYLQNFARITLGTSDAILDIKEFTIPVKMREICDAVEGEVLVGEEAINLDVFGYTVIDSIKAIQSLSGVDFYRIFGSTSERALVFTRVSKGRSPMIAVKISPFKPRLVVLHGRLKTVDKLALGLAKLENVPLVISRMPSVEELIESLNALSKKAQPQL